MLPLSMTLSNLWPRFQGHDIFWSRISWKGKVTIAQWNGTMFVDLDWPLNALRRFSASAELLVHWVGGKTEGGGGVLGERAATRSPKGFPLFSALMIVDYHWSKTPVPPPLPTPLVKPIFNFTSANEVTFLCLFCQWAGWKLWTNYESFGWVGYSVT